MELLNALALYGNFVFIPAFAYGSQLALGALGVTLIYAVLRFGNFAHGDTMAFGTAMTILATWGLQTAGISFGPLPTALLALPFGIAATIALVLVTDRVVYRYHRARKAAPINFLILSIGVMFILNGLNRLVLGTGDVRFDDGARFIFRARDFEQWTGLAEGISLRTTQAVSIVVAVIAMAALFTFLARTRTGKAMRAFSDNEDLALLSGIDPKAVVRITWILAAILATLAGVLYGLDKSYKPFTYFQILLPIFAAAIVGGIGNPAGAVLGGYLIAFTSDTLTYVWKQFLTYAVPGWEPEGLLQLLSTEYKAAITFAILVVVLLVRPSGILKGQS